jgi:hypothetical protein
MVELILRKQPGSTGKEVIQQKESLLRTQLANEDDGDSIEVVGFEVV